MDEELRATWREQLRRLVASLPADYATAKADLTAISNDFHAEVAKGLEPQLNRELRQLPRATLGECRNLAAFCNAELSELGLCIRCPRTSLGTILVADYRDLEHDAPRFRLQTRGGRGEVHRTYTSRELPHLEFMRDTSDRSKGPAGRAGR